MSITHTHHYVFAKIKRFFLFVCFCLLVYLSFLSPCPPAILLGLFLVKNSGLPISCTRARTLTNFPNSNI